MSKRKSTPVEDWITAKQASEILGVSSRYVHTLVAKGTLEGRMIGGLALFVNPDSLANWKPKKKRKPKEGKPIES